jgi:hypothetical protein
MQSGFFFFCDEVASLKLVALIGNGAEKLRHMLFATNLFGGLCHVYFQ